MKITAPENLLAATLIGTLLFTITTARAEEGGTGHYAPGSFASFVDVLPGDPSVGVFNYFLYYDGSANVSRQFPIGGQIAFGVNATSYADSPGLFWITPLTILGAQYAAGATIPFVATKVRAQVVGPLGNTVSRSDSVSGLGDIELFPVALSWTLWSTNLHVDLFGGIYTPSGEYIQNRLANQGLGYWTFEPGVMISYLGQKNGIEFSTYIGYDINTEHALTDYQSGQQFHVDVTLAQHFPLGKNFAGIGATGFYIQQTTGDSGSGARLGSFEEMTAGVGPVLSYAGKIGKTPFAAELKWLPQISTQNTLKGDYIWFKVGVQF
jgi:hypothetical protein